MSKRAVISYKSGKVKAAAVAPVVGPFGSRWHEKAGLLLLGMLLLCLSFAPIGQFYLAWFGVVPWLIVLRRSRSQVRVFFWSWIAGTLFFVANMWWLWNVTGPGMLALMLLLGLYWAVAGLIIRGAGLLGSGEPLTVAGATTAADSQPIMSPPLYAIRSMVLISAVWVALEWLRGNYPLNGLPWLYLGHTQSPVLALCQIADVSGVYGVSFCVAMVNVWIALYFLNRSQRARLLPSAAALAVFLLLVVSYGFFRMHQHTTTTGPTVLVVQPNYPQKNTEKGEAPEKIVAFHLSRTEQALREHPGVNLVVWSETMMPHLNASSREFWRREAPEWGSMIDQTHESILALARRYSTAFLVGGMYGDRWQVKWDKSGYAHGAADDRRNVAYFYKATGPSDLRYDKIHLVPFGEYLPFRSSIPPLYRLFLSLSPYDEEYTLNAGSIDHLTVFDLKPNEDAAAGWRFVTPICFEDIDPGLVHQMFQPQQTGGKRADFLVNITNDGWFKANEMAQHLQAAIFRSIENRVPSARSVNTGISGFIDSTGHTHGLIPVGIEGVSIATLQLDSRTTWYTRFGDVFAVTCAIVASFLGIRAMVRRWAKSWAEERAAIQGD